MDYIIIAILLMIASLVIYYLYRLKKRGQTCVGCPYAKQCGNKGSCPSPKKP